MIQLIQTYLPNVYKLGWSGQYGWGTAIYLTLYMTVISFIIGGFLGLVTGLLLVLTRPGGVIENRIVFQILDKITSLFRAIPFIILLAFINPLTYLLLKNTIGPTSSPCSIVPSCLSILCPPSPSGLVRIGWWCD